jgi:hypothetical protein
MLLTLILTLGLTFPIFSQIPDGCGLNYEPTNNIQQNLGVGACQLSTNAFPTADIDVVPNVPNARLKLHLNFIFVQKDDGSLMFDMGNSDQSTLFTNTVDRMNYMVSNAVFSDACSNACTENFISDLQIEFIPHYTHIQNTFYWNHENDPNPNILNSRNKSFLSEIVALARMEDTYYTEGFDLIYTAEGTEAEQQLLYPDEYHWDLPDYSLTYSTGSGNAPAYSMFPTTNQSTNMQLHMPNTYRGYLSNTHNPTWDTCESDWWSIEQEAIDQAEGLLHEIGHGLGLGHGSACGDNTNVMSPNGCHRQKLNGCQVWTIWNRLMTTNLRSIVDCEEAHLVNYIVEEDMVWSNSLNIYGDVIVRNNATLTVTCELFFSEDRSIIVEKGSRLVLDGALLTSMNECEYKWRGIKVVGDNDSFAHDVIVKNRTRIENAVEAINMFPPIPWPETQSFGNGTVIATNSFFTNNNKDIGFISFSPIFNNSVINNCEFTGARESITNWNCQGISIEDSRFEEISETAIFSGTGSFTLSENYFQSGIQDIYMANSFASNSWNIENNNIFNGPTGILHVGGSVSDHQIYNNTFHSEDQGLYVDGIGSYDFLYNTIIDNETGIVSNNSVFTNSIEGNSFTDCSTGIDFSENNNGTSFIKNCFTNSRQDIYISGKVADLIGSPQSEAGNCFSDDQIATSPDPNAGIPGIAGVHSHFTYFLFPDGALNCKDVMQTQYFDFFDSQNDVEECDEGDTGGTPPFENPWPIRPEILPLTQGPITDDAEAQSIINSLFTLRSDINQSSMRYKDEAIKIVEGKIDQISLQLFEFYIAEQDYTAARNSMENIFTEYKPLFLFSVDLYEQDYDRAIRTLQDIGYNSEEWIDFKKTQLINIKFLSDGRREVVNLQEINKLKSMGLKNNPLSSYARGLYTILTGVKLTSPIPQREIKERVLQPDNNEEDSQKSFTVYPNITSTTFSVEAYGYEDSHYSVFDIQGNEIKNGKITEHFMINTSSWSVGTYIFVLKQDDMVSEKKLIIVTK